jgi:hypothetical protein
LLFFSEILNFGTKFYIEIQAYSLRFGLKELLPRCCLLNIIPVWGPIL